MDGNIAFLADNVAVGFLSSTQLYITGNTCNNRAVVLLINASSQKIFDNSDAGSFIFANYVEH